MLLSGPEIHEKAGFQTGRSVQLLTTRYWCGRSGIQFPGRSNRHSVANGSPQLRLFVGFDSFSLNISFLVTKPPTGQNVQRVAEQADAHDVYCVVSITLATSLQWCPTNDAGVRTGPVHMKDAKTEIVPAGPSMEAGARWVKNYDVRGVLGYT